MPYDFNQSVWQESEYIHTKRFVIPIIYDLVWIDKTYVCGHEYILETVPEQCD